MDRRQHSNEILLDLTSSLWGFLEQWKAILVFSLIISLLAAGFKYRQDTSAYNAQVEAAKVSNLTVEEADQRIRNTLDSLSAEDRLTVEQALGFHSLIMERQAYAEGSPIMHIDYNNTRIVTLGFQVSGDVDASVSSLGDGYIAALNDDSALETISKATSTSIDTAYVKELLSFSDPETALYQTPDNLLQGDNTFNVFLIIPPGEDPDAIKDAVVSIFSSKSSELSKIIAPHSIKLVYNSTSTSTCNNIYIKQSDLYSSISTLKGSLNAVVTALTEPQSAAYNTILQLESAASDDSSVSSNQSVAKPRISIKNLLMGFALGIIIYIFLFVLYSLFNQKIPSAKIAKNILHEQLIGEIYDMNPSHNFMWTLFHSPAVFSYRHRASSNPEAQAETVAQSIAAVSAKEASKSLSLISTDVRQKKVIHAVATACEDNGLYVTDIYDSANLYGALNDASNVVIVVSRESTASQLQALTDVLDFYRIKILGFVFTSDH